MTIDYASLATITGVTEYMKKHAETRWGSTKYVDLRCLEQRENLKKYFLKFLPLQKNFKKEVEKTQRYVQIKTALGKPIMEAYVSFVAFVAHDFQKFLVPFQSTKPIPVPCPLQIDERVTEEEIRHEDEISSDDATKNVYINVGDDRKILEHDSHRMSLWPLI